MVSVSCGGRKPGEAGPDVEPTHPTAHQPQRPHWFGGRRRDLPRCRWAAAGPGRGAGGPRGLAGQRADAPDRTSATKAPLVWRAPEGPEGTGLAAAPVGGGRAWPGIPEPQEPPVWRAPEGPEGTGGLRGAAPNEVRPPSLAGGRALRRPEHQWSNRHIHRHRNDKAGRNPSVPARP